MREDGSLRVGGRNEGDDDFVFGLTEVARSI